MKKWLGFFTIILMTVCVFGEEWIGVPGNNFEKPAIIMDDTNGLEIKYVLKGLHISDILEIDGNIYNGIDLPGSNYSYYDFGEPAIPYFEFIVEIRGEIDAQSLEVLSVEFFDEVDLDNPLVPLKDMNREDFIKNEFSYENFDSTSDIDAEIQYIGNIRGVHLAKIKINPVKYKRNESLGINFLKVINKIQFRINYAGSLFDIDDKIKLNKFATSTSTFDNYFKNNVLNYVAVKELALINPLLLSSSAKNFPEHIIVFNSAGKNNNFYKQIKRYQNWITQKGFDTALIDLASPAYLIYSSPTKDIYDVPFRNDYLSGDVWGYIFDCHDAAKLWNYIMDNYVSSIKIPSFISLVGDINDVPTFGDMRQYGSEKRDDGTGTIRTVPNFEFYSTDNYYGILSSTVSLSESYFQNSNIGRIPVQDSSGETADQQLERFLDRTIMYETGTNQNGQIIQRAYDSILDFAKIEAKIDMAALTCIENPVVGTLSSIYDFIKFSSDSGYSAEGSYVFDDSPISNINNDNICGINSDNSCGQFQFSKAGTYTTSDICALNSGYILDRQNGGLILDDGTQGENALRNHLTAMLLSDQTNFLMYHYHGNRNYMGWWYNNNYANFLNNSLQNGDAQPIVYGIGCLMGRFAFPSCVGDVECTWLFNNQVAALDPNGDIWTGWSLFLTENAFDRRNLIKNYFNNLPVNSYIYTDQEGGSESLSVAETWLRSGSAAGFIGATRVTNKPNDGIYERLQCSIMPGFSSSCLDKNNDGVVNNDDRYSEIFATELLREITEWNNFHHRLYQWFGDPSLNIYIEQPSKLNNKVLVNFHRTANFPGNSYIYPGEEIGVTLEISETITIPLNINISQGSKILYHDIISSSGTKNIKILSSEEYPDSSYPIVATIKADGFLYFQSVAGLESTDTDKDGIVDPYDNCVSVYNRMVKDTLPYQELFSAKYSGASYLALTSPFYGYFSPGRKYYIWQPDHDLDGKGDACDFEDSSFSDGFFYSQITDVKGKSGVPDQLFSFFAPINISATVTLKMPVNSGEGSPRCFGGCPVAVHYCAVGHEEKDRWGEDSFCTTTEKTENPAYKDTDFACDFGFSHGSDDFNYRSIRRWQKRISTGSKSFAGLEEYSDNPNEDPTRSYFLVSSSSAKETDWFWRRDWYGEKECYLPTNYNNPICVSLRNAGSYNEEFTMYYTLSTNVMNRPLGTQFEPLEPVNDYALYNNNNELIINQSYFRTDNIYTRSFRYGHGGDNTGIMKLNYWKRNLPDVPPEIEIPEKEYCISCYWNVPWQFVVGEDGAPLPEAEKESLGRWSLIKVNENSYGFSSQQLYMPENINIIAEVGDQKMIAVTTRSLGATAEHELRFNTDASGADWSKIGIISNWDSNIQSVKSATERDGILYFIGLSNNVLKLIIVLPPDFGIVINNICDTPYPIYTIHEYDVPKLVEDSIQKIKIMEVAGSIYLIGTSRANERIKTYKLTENNTLAEIEGLNPLSRNILNTGKSGKYIYLTGGEGYLLESMTDIWRFDTETEVWEQIPVTLNGDFRKVITQIVDGKLVVANPVIDGNTTHPAFEIDPNIENINDLAGSLSYVEIPVTEVTYEMLDKYCLNETDNLLKGGFDISGTCIPFTHPWYRQFSAGATVYSVAGKGDRLYVGTSSSIKVYDISDPAAMTLKYTFSTNSRIVYDLEVTDGDIMYAATSKGLYKLSTANPDTLTSLTFYSTGSYNYQYKIQLYNDKLYVGDDNGINIRDKNTFARLAYVNTGSILDFAIADGEIASYWSAFWDEGIQIRDADTLNMKAYDYATCYTGELTADHGEFYLSCDDYEYRFVGLPNTYLDYFPVDGDIREMQENYVYNGWAYIPDGSYVKQSTSNDVPAVCGNGVTEPGELCDGNSVECTTLDPEYIGGTAACNSTCDGYNEVNCEVDGW